LDHIPIRRGILSGKNLFSKILTFLSKYFKVLGWVEVYYVKKYRFYFLRKITGSGHYQGQK